MPRNNRRQTHRLASRKMIESARELRRNPTRAEALLWSRVRRKALGGFRFRRQHPVGPYIVDFFCNEANLVVELDGEIHFDPPIRHRDLSRARDLEAHGLKVLRLGNRQVIEDTAGALEIIRRTLIEIVDQD